jgi:hypothetical protein
MFVMSSFSISLRLSLSRENDVLNPPDISEWWLVVQELVVSTKNL